MTTLAGRYEITKELGGGAFGITYLAKDTMQPSQPLCVVKQLRPHQTSPRVIDFFNKEAAILEKLGKHPQIPQLLAHFQQDDNLYIVQEFIQGHDLSKEISPGKRLSEAYVRKFLKEVLEILSFVHKYRVIHRDIKPENLMRRREDDKIFLIDFGAVKELGSLMVNAKGEVKSSIVIGTPGYMPNEQGSGKPCFASDVYAVGMSAIAALTGIQPHELEENPQTGEVIWLEKAQVSQDLAKVITKMVRRHHSLRYSSTKDVLQALSSLLRLTPYISTPQPTSSKPQRQPTPTPAVSKVLRQKPLNLPSEPTPKPLKTPLTPTVPLPSTDSYFSHWKRLGIFGFAGASLIAVVLVSIMFFVKDILKRREFPMRYIAHTMNRVQQSYYMNKKGFTSNIQYLRPNIAFETNYYSLKAVPQPNDKSVMNIVQTKNKKLRSYLGLKPKSYLGLVYVTNINKNITTIAQLCVSSQSLSKPPVMPKLPQNARHNDIKCPPGFKAIQ